VANVHFVAGEMTKKQNKGWLVGWVKDGVEGELFLWVAHTQVIRIEEKKSEFV